MIRVIISQECYGMTTHKFAGICIYEIKMCTFELRTCYEWQKVLQMIALSCIRCTIFSMKSC